MTLYWYAKKCDCNTIMRFRDVDEDSSDVGLMVTTSWEAAWMIFDNCFRPKSNAILRKKYPRGVITATYIFCSICGSRHHIRTFESTHTEEVPDPRVSSQRAKR